MKITNELEPYAFDSKKGCWKKKSRWDLIVFGVITILIGGAYIGHVNEKGSQSSHRRDGGSIGQSFSKSASLQEVCTKTQDGSCSFASKENLLKWQAFLESESEVEKLKAETPVKVTAHVTMYTSRVAETDDSPCIAANGKDICKLLSEGVQTCASNDYKLGSRLQIQGLGECTVMDRMNKRYTGTGRIDWYAGFDLARARSHGVKNLMIAVLK